MPIAFPPSKRGPSFGWPENVFGPTTLSYAPAPNMDAPGKMYVAFQCDLGKQNNNINFCELGRTYRNVADTALVNDVKTSFSDRPLSDLRVFHRVMNASGALGSLINPGTFSTTLASTSLAAAGAVINAGSFSTTLADCLLSAVGEAKQPSPLPIARGGGVPWLVSPPSPKKKTPAVVAVVEGVFSVTLTGFGFAALGFVGEKRAAVLVEIPDSPQVEVVEATIPVVTVSSVQPRRTPELVVVPSGAAVLDEMEEVVRMLVYLEAAGAFDPEPERLAA